MYFEGILQINLRVKNLNKAIDWYKENLGLRLQVNYDDHTAIMNFNGNSKINSPVICLIKLNDEEEFPTNSQNGTYPVLNLSPAYSKSLYDIFKKNGVKVETNPSNKAHFKFFDLEGNQFEVLSPGIYN